MVSSLRFAARSLIRSPGFTLLAIITLGLGIGANTGMFSILNSILLKPLPSWLPARRAARINPIEALRAE